MLESLALLAQAAASPSLAADFVLWIGHPSVFHDELFAVLTETIVILLAEGLSVHLWPVSVADDGSEGTRNMVILLATPAAVCARWVRDLWHDIITTHDPSSRHSVDDLDFENPRALVDAQLVLTGPKHPPAWHPEAIPPAVVYNHRTGLFCDDASARQYPAMSHPCKSLPRCLRCSCSRWMPVRGDLYTVREMARMKGFDDGSRFLEATLPDQYAQVWEACPPRLSNSVAILVGHVTALMVLRRDGHAGFTHFLPHSGTH